ncbi:hypothetical protein [Ruegeria arenilitoris]|uniref:hypothetical protein n=1 Tax=Ruegeria arenilitoris TaxID=1173585 RepID=UPI0014807B52|nr:hypothetical protein [Ruegeria arenilitoris]
MATENTVTHENTVISLRDLKEAVGTHFFVWSMLERRMKQVLCELDADGTSQPVHGVSRTLDRWRQLHKAVTPSNPEHLEFVDEVFAIMADGLIMRNRIAHGISGFNAEGRTASNVFIRTELNGKVHEITYEALESTNNLLGYIASHLDRISSAVLNQKASGAANIYADVRNSLRKYRVPLSEIPDCKPPGV